ncbi:VRR-NUC domain-containing protein [Microvirga sp. STS02]|uniref:VRR-NUC domain-containing protein n=1 Tax=Hymenobacter negativus TaxID=2795026 RepID=UPI0018DBEC6F|nr:MULTISPECIES: VRR-NUC domain-containing protein [Bacteria]MBH8569372.1 VRR-NUC domain-containing protein [Hymenobacter negativus]MBR7209106.1 VRR-NUC domain-containing protein [Microvirga sp. STS02]
MNRPKPMPVADFRRNYTQGRTPAYCAQSDAATAKAAAKAQRSTAKKPSPTNALTKAVVQLLTLAGCKAWRQNNGAVYDPTREVFRAGSATPGISDVLGYHRATGRFVAVEIKTGSDKLSPEQTSFLAEVRRAGGFACEGRDLDQIRKEFLTWCQHLTS